MDGMEFDAYEIGCMYAGMRPIEQHVVVPTEVFFYHLFW